MPFLRRATFDWKLRSRTLALGSRTLLMAIVNVTPDSFSGDGVGSLEPEIVARKVLALLDGGADIVDLGAESTRPNAHPLSADEEQLRLLPILDAIFSARHEALVSVDTYHAATALQAAARGVEIINDVSGGTWDSGMPQAMADTDCGVILMHTRGRPQEWRSLPLADRMALTSSVARGLQQRLDAARSAGVREENIVLDPGFGFGTLGADNFTLLANFDELAALGRPLMAGVSRKKFLGDAVAAVQPLGLSLPAARMHATAAAGVAAILAGAHILRVHDLQAARESAAVADAILAAL